MNTFTATAFAEENPNIFLSADGHDDSWRMMEIVVAIIESFLQGKQTETISSTKMKDIVGDPEQIDVAQLSKFNPAQFFRFVEVRDRTSKVRRNYVQEIMGKRTSTQIPKCCIVSTKGFTRNAKKLAANQGVELRLLTVDRSPKDQSWFGSDSTAI